MPEINDQNHGRRLESPDNLGAPMQQYWAPGVRHRVGLRRARFDFGAGWLPLAAFGIGAALFVLAVLLRAG